MTDVNKFYDADPAAGRLHGTWAMAAYLNSLGLPPTILDPVRLVSASATVNKDSDHILLVDASAAPVTLTLPSVLDLFPGRRFAVKKIDASANAVTLTPSGSETIDGEATISLKTENEIVELTAATSDYYLFPTPSSRLLASMLGSYSATLTADGTIPFLSTWMACSIDPGDAERNADPSGDFSPGSMVLVTNSGSGFNLVFDSGGLAEAIPPGMTALFILASYSGGAWVSITGFCRDLYEDNSILAAASANTPSALQLLENRIIGRITGGNIAGLSISQCLDMIGTTQEGDVLFRDSGQWARKARGTDGQSLVLVAGKPDWSWSGVVQVVEATPVNSPGLTAQVIPWDDTKPQISEGEEVITVSITPKSATNRLRIEARCDLVSSSGTSILGALFQDAIASALAATAVNIPTANTFLPLALRHEMAAGTTSAITFRLRLGAASGSTTYWLRNASTAHIFDGLPRITLTVTELTP